MNTSDINSHGNKQMLWRWAVGLMAPSVCHIVSLHLSSFPCPRPPELYYQYYHPEFHLALQYCILQICL